MFVPRPPTRSLPDLFHRIQIAIQLKITGERAAARRSPPRAMIPQSKFAFVPACLLSFVVLMLAVRAEITVHATRHAQRNAVIQSSSDSVGGGT